MDKLKRYSVYGLVATIVALSVYVSVLRHRVTVGDRILAKQIQERSAALGGVQVELDRERELTVSLSAENARFLAEIGKIDQRVRPVVHASVDASVADRVVLGPNEHRFAVETVMDPVLENASQTSHVLVRRQAFHLDVLVVRNVDDKIDLASTSLVELDPDSKVPLDSKFSLDSHVQISDRIVNASAVSVFHPRVVAGVETHGYPLVGVEVLNGERFGGPILGHLNASLLGVYNPRDKTVLGGISIGYRLFNSNVTVGPAFFYPSRQFGALVSVQLSR